MSRRELREQVFKMLFRVEFHTTEDVSQQLELFFEDIDDSQSKRTEQDQQYIEHKFKDIVAHLQEIDDKINQVAERWKTSRMGKVDLTLIRLAVYEIQFEEDVPTGVAINEAVELAKKYGTDESPSFVNGILAKFA
ncbi:MAG: transcription antitermination factor NusB [Lachnospiraceae bacterium]